MLSDWIYVICGDDVVLSELWCLVTCGGDSFRGSCGVAQDFKHLFFVGLENAASLWHHSGFPATAVQNCKRLHGRSFREGRHHPVRFGVHPGLSPFVAVLEVISSLREEEEPVGLPVRRT